MAISGCFKDVKFAEVLKIVAKRTGRLWIYSFSSHLYSEWFVHENHVRAVRFNKEILASNEAVFRAAALLSEDTTSSYIFYNLDLDRIPVEMSISISEISLNSVKTTSLDANDELLPNPDTKFKTAVADLTKIPAELIQFWNLSALQNCEDFTAHEIAAKTCSELKQVRANFYQLRTLGFIRPVRAVSTSAAEISTAVPPSEQIFDDVTPPPRKSLIQRMLGAFPSKQIFR